MRAWPPAAEGDKAEGGLGMKVNQLHIKVNNSNLFLGCCAQLLDRIWARDTETGCPARDLRAVNAYNFGQRFMTAALFL
jgi:hypothetical protein